MKIAYVPKRFNADHALIIQRADELCVSYQRQGYNLTLRQLYYQFVKNNWLPNTQQNYNKLKGIISDARRAGLISWTAIEDRGRNRKGDFDGITPSSFDELFKDAAGSYFEDLWADQPRRIEVWVEKESLIDFVSRACRSLRVTHFACKGYVSDSEMWRAGRRFAHWDSQGRSPLILHLGDHDPSGIDMTRDIADRLKLYSGIDVPVERIALNMDQIEQYGPPPNPAKVTDSRYHGYVREYGVYSWELDSLDPEDMVALIEEQIRQHMDLDAWHTANEHEDEERAKMVDLAERVARNWDEVESFLASLD